MLAVWWMHRQKFHGRLDHAQDVLLLIQAAAGGVLVSASIGVISLLAFNLLAVQDAR